MSLGATGTGVLGTGTSAAVPVPAGVASGHLIMLYGYLHNNADTISAANFPTGAGDWNVAFDINTTSISRGRIIVAWKWATGADSGTYNVTWTTSSTYEWVAQRYINMFKGSAGPIDANGQAQSTSNTAVTIQAAAFTLAMACDVIYAASNHATNAGNWTGHASFPEIYDNFTLTGGVAHLYLGGVDNRAAGAVGAATHTLSGTTGNSLPKIVGFGLRREAVPLGPVIRGVATPTTADVSWAYPTLSDARTSQEIRINGGTPIALGASDSTYHFDSLTPETIYTVEVRGVNQVGNGDWSKAKLVVTGSSVGGVNRLYFTGPANWTVPEGVLDVKVLVVAGGGAGAGIGGGSMNANGGGGGGGVEEDLAHEVIPGTVIPVNGGLGAIGMAASNLTGARGEQSYFDDIVVDGGGGGGTTAAASQMGASSGGGAGNSGSGGFSTAGAVSGLGLGFVGGAGFRQTINGVQRSGGGGGGASAAGTDGGNSNGGEGGDGYAYDTSVFGTLIGESGRVGAGGGGGRNDTSGNGTVGIGGIGGGGNGSFTNTTAEAGSDLCGGGGGGGIAGANGGDGLVVLVWEDPDGEALAQSAYWGISLVEPTGSVEYNGPTFQGTLLEAINTRNTQTSTARTGQTWDIIAPCEISFVEYMADVRTAGDYKFYIDGVLEAIKYDIAALTPNVSFTIPGGRRLAAGNHTLKLEQVGGAAIQWYNCGNILNAIRPQGDGGRILGWEEWIEPGGSAGVPGTVKFRPPDDVVWSWVEDDSTSGATFAQATWDVTFGVNVHLHAVLKRFLDDDTYTLKIDGVDRGSYSTIFDNNIYGAVVLSTPLALAAGTHEFQFDPVNDKQMSYTNDPAAPVAGNSSVTAWSTWDESTGDKQPAVLVYTID